MENKNISRNLNIAAGQFAKEKEYWKNKLSGELEKSFFPYDPGKFISQDTRKKVVTFKMDGELFERLAQITGRSFPKVHMILVAGTAALLARYTGNRDIIVGTPIDKQDSEEALVNTILPLRVRLYDNITFKELLLEVRKVINEAIENQNFPIETLIPGPDEPAGGPDQYEASFPLFDVMVLLENIQYRKYVERFQPGIMFLFRWTDDGIEGEVEYKASCYGEESIKRIIRLYLRLMRTALFDVNLEIGDIELLSKEDKSELTSFNRTRAEYPHQATIHELFELQVEKTPGNIALIDEKGAPGAPLSYRQLNDRANRWTKSLANRGVNPNTIIGILLRQSMEQVCAIFAVLKRGCAYLPVDIDYPPERKSYMLEDSGAALLITQSDLAKDLEWDGEIVYIDDIETQMDEPGPGNPRVQPSDLAYVIYTSGSTGKSKGTAVEHRALVNYAWWAAKSYVKNETVHFPLFTTTAFDLTATSIFTPLITGNSIIIYRGEEKEFLVEKVFNENKVEVLKLTPVHLMFIGDYTGVENDSKIKRFIVGGEQLETHLAHKIDSNFSGKVEIYNEYGPTEATVGCMIYKFDPRKDTGPSVPIGTPADNVQIYLLDENMKHVPTGCIGELYIAGDGLARGYLNNPGLTAERFIGVKVEVEEENEQCPMTNDRLYKTGDMALRLADGNIEFLGRADRQVKIRGYRIEIDEVEDCLLKHERIDRAVVLAKDDEKGYKYLAAYIVPSGQVDSAGPAEMDGDIDINVEELRNYLSGYLPDFMIPSYFVPLDKLPVTVNGKIDRKALPEPGKNVLDTGAQYLPPTTELEKTMVGIWQDVMGVETVGIEDSYFALGGDSIKAIQISARLQKFKLKLELKDLFQYTTIKELANHIKPVKEISYQGMIEGEVKLTPIQEWFFQKNFTDEHHFNQSVMLHRFDGFDEEITKKVFNKLVEHHDALRMVFKREGGKIRQTNRGFTDGFVDIEVFDIRSENDYKKVIVEKCSRIQGSIDLNAGPLVKLSLFKSINGDYLLIAIHHLVIDTVSWRILSEDFASLYRQIENGVEKEKLEIPLKSTSYKEWAEKLHEYSNSEKLIKELKYWQKIENTGPFFYSKNKGRIKGKNKDSSEITFELPGKYTDKLLRQVNSAYNTEINDILLTALGLAVSDWAGAQEVPLILEGHGREEIIPGVDITRTVGWFTSVYPVVLKMKNRDDVSSVIKDTKEMLRNIPCKGIGYGILRYLTNEENKQGIKFGMKPEISFNYLGQFDEDINTESFQEADISPGNSVSLNMERIYPLYILGRVFNGKLRISVSYDAGNFEENEIRVFLDGYESRLRQIIDHCTAKKDTEFTLSDFSASIDGSEVELVFAVLNEISPGNAIKKSDITDMYFLTPMQEGMLLHYLMDKTAPAYFEQMSYRIRGELDFKSLEQAYVRIIDRYDVLRTLFVFEKVRRPLQVVLKNRNTSVYYEDISNPDEEETERRLEEFKFKDKKRGFDLSEDILIRLAVLKVAHNRYEIIWSFHHIIMDGWCTSILIKDMLLIYNYLKQGETVNLPPAVPYKYYIKWLEKQDKEKGIEYWKNYLANYENQVAVPFYHNNGPGEKNRFEQKEYRFKIDKTFTRKLERLSKKNNLTISTIFQTLWGILLQKYNNIDDVVFGSVVSGRPTDLEGVETMVGLFINTIPIRIKNDPGETFVNLLKKVQAQIIQSKLYEFVPLAEIQSNSLLKRELVNHILVFENYPVVNQIENISPDNSSNFFVESVEVFEQTNYDLNVIAFLSVEGELRVDIRYNSLAYNADVIKRIEAHLIRLIEQVSVNREIPMEEIEIISSIEKNQLLFDFNSTETADYPKDKTLVELFEEQVEKAPYRIAIEGLEARAEMQLLVSLSYKELNLEANQLALLLREKRVNANDIVGIMVERSPDMIIGIMGILKAGGAYLPIAPEYPQERIKYILGDSNTSVLVTQTKFRDKVKFEGEVVSLGNEEIYKDKKITDNLIYVNVPTDIVYVIYTSGTTGKPKGTIIEHTSLVNRLNWMQRLYPLTKADRILQKTPFTFDVSVWELFWWSIVGSRVYFLVPGGEKDPGIIVETIEKYKISIMHFVPSMLNVFLEYVQFTGAVAKLSSLKQVFASGETLTLHQVEAFNELLYQQNETKLVNLYGPTEATIDVSYFDCFPSAVEKYKNIPIGKPIDNINLYIVDRGCHLQPVGVPGELVISGVGLARGYLNRPVLTAEKFVEHMSYMSHMSYIYKTGDLARWLTDGNMEFLGRIDHQVKIRGFRIELGEIESWLSNHEDIENAVVIAARMFETDEDKQLCCYIVSNREFTSIELKEYLAKKLPNYMIPSYFMKLEKIPLTQSGKVDKRSLNSISKKLDMGVKYAAPKSVIEKTIADIWREILRVDKVGIHDNFFDLGGNSLKVIPLANRLKQTLNREVTVVELFEYVTIDSLAEYLTKKKKETKIPDPTIERVKAFDEAKKGRANRRDRRRGGHLNA